MNRRQAKKAEKKAYLRFLGIDIEEDDIAHDCWMQGEAIVANSDIDYLNNEKWDRLVSKEAFREYQDWNKGMIENTKYIKLPSRKMVIHPNGGDPCYYFVSPKGGEYISGGGDMTKTQIFDLLTDEEKAVVVFHRYFHKY
jgi:hypothetical protein